MKVLLINRDQPPLNRNKKSTPFELFDSQGTKLNQMKNHEIDSFCCSSFIMIFKELLFYRVSLYLADLGDLYLGDFDRSHLIVIL